MRIWALLVSISVHGGLLWLCWNGPSPRTHDERRAVEVELVPYRHVEARRAPQPSTPAPATARKGVSRRVTIAAPVSPTPAPDALPVGDGAPAGVPDGGVGPGLVVGTSLWPGVAAEPTPTRGEDRAAVVRTIPRIGYPPEARDDGVEGVVRLLVMLDASGHVRGVEIRSDPGSGLGEAAREALLRATFEPALSDGRPTPTAFEYVYRFELK